ncbi:Chromosome (plasmid) partitioning protein ParB [Caballeronia sordidicola]|uniref:Chromosome (Plasmid) partitioning protein ParB n=2 Tax=Caballeronia sordidicola TaxID=196367 RepID=A0A226WT53_CABSO|nr:Chromosome (plasmid) partitioning protein ParB [Caballeronia sordidicola]
MGKTADLANKVAATSRPSIADQAPVTMPGQLGAFRLEAQRYAAQIQTLTEQLEDAKKGGGAIELSLGELHEVPGRRKMLSEVKYAELRENLRQNELVHPITVRGRALGGYEIVSGHHRIDAFRELGRPTIRAVINDGTDDQADLGAFYANLFQSDLTDYEKYLGFRDIQQRYPSATQAKLAEQAGVSPALLSMLMAFEALPGDVKQLLQVQPNMLGAHAAHAMATLTKEGRGGQVSLAVARLAKGELDQASAVKAASSPLHKKAPEKATAVRIRAGRSTYCDLRQTKNILRLEFQNADEARAVSGAIQSVLEERARLSKQDVD